MSGSKSTSAWGNGCWTPRSGSRGRALGSSGRDEGDSMKEEMRIWRRGRGENERVQIDSGVGRLGYDMAGNRDSRCRDDALDALRDGQAGGGSS